MLLAGAPAEAGDWVLVADADPQNTIEHYCDRLLVPDPDGGCLGVEDKPYEFAQAAGRLRLNPPRPPAACQRLDNRKRTAPKAASLSAGPPATRPLGQSAHACGDRPGPTPEPGTGRAHCQPLDPAQHPAGTKGCYARVRHPFLAAKQEPYRLPPGQWPEDHRASSRRQTRPDWRLRP